MCLQGIKQQIFDRLTNNELMNNESYDFVDHCDYLELENIIPKTIPRDNLNLLQMNVRGLFGKQNKMQSLLDKLENYSNIHCIREGAARAGNDFRPPVSSQPVLVLNANYVSRFLTYFTPPKT